MDSAASSPSTWGAHTGILLGLAAVERLRATRCAANLRDAD